MGHQQQITNVERMRFFKDDAGPARAPPPRSSAASILSWDTNDKGSGGVASTPPRGRGSGQHGDRPSPILAWNDKNFGRSHKPEPKSQIRSGRRNISSTDLSWKDELSRPHLSHEKCGILLPHQGLKNVSSNDFEWNAEPTHNHSKDELRSRPQRFLKKQDKEEKQEHSRPQGDATVSKAGDGVVRRQHQTTPTRLTRHRNSDKIEAKRHPNKSLGTRSLVSLASDESSQVEFATSRTSNFRAERRETRGIAQMDDCQSLVSASTTSDVFPAKAHRPRQEDVQSYVSASDTSELRPQEARSRASESATSELFPQGSGSATSELFPQDFQSYVSGSATSESRLQDAQSYVSGSAMSELRPQDHRDHFTRPRGQRSDAGNSKASSSYQRSDAGNSRTSSSTHSNAGKKGASSQASQAHRVCPGGELRPVPGGELRPPTPSKRGNTPRSAHTPSQASRPTFSPKPRSDADWLADSVSGNKMDRSCSVASTSICGSESSISEAWGGASVCASTSA